MKNEKIVVLIISIIIFLCSKNAFGQAITGPCDPLPCPAPSRTQIDTAINVFDTLLYNQSIIRYDANNSPYMYTYKGDTLQVQCGWIYKFKVQAGGIYEWNTDISHGVVSTVGNNLLRTKITLFYDDDSTYATVSQEAVHSIVPGCAAAGLAWKANYTGTVGIMVTRGDNGFDMVGDFCACNNDPLLLRYNQLAYPDNSNFIVWGRYGITDTLPCDDDIHYVYDSGLNAMQENASGNYSNNENGYLVLYPEDIRSKLKLWGSCKLQDGDTLFIYNGDYSQNQNLIAFEIITGQQELGNEENPIFMSQIAGEPISLRMKSDSSCTLTGFELSAKCCVNPGLPTNLVGEMVSDTSAFLHWHPAEGSDIVYNWNIYCTKDSSDVCYGSTRDTCLTIDYLLNPNESYFYTISVISACSKDTVMSDGNMDVVFSNTFCYPYFVTLNQPIESFDSFDSLFIPENAVLDSITHVITHTTDMRVCYGDTANICFSLPANINVPKQFVWRSSYNIDTIVLTPDTSFSILDTNVYICHSSSNIITGCFRIDSVRKDGYVLLDVYTDGGSLAKAVLHIFVDTIPNVYITYNDVDTNELTSCEGSPLTFVVHGANTYCWTDSLETLRPSYCLSNSLTQSPIQNNIYYVSGIDGNGCKSSDSIKVNINPLPDLEYARNIEICRGDSTLIRVEGIEQYIWQRLDTIRWDTTVFRKRSINSPFLEDVLSLHPLDDSLYYIYRTCNQSKDTIVMTRTQPHDPSFNADSIFIRTCTYEIGYWDLDTLMRIDSVTIAQGTMDSLWVSPNISTDYLVFGVDSNGCFCRTPATIHVNVFQRPQVVDTHNSGIACARDTVTLSVTMADAEHCFYEWSLDGDSIILSRDTILYFIPDSMQIIRFRAINSYGCDTVIKFSVNIFPQFDLQTQAFPDTICQNQCCTLSFLTTNVTYWEWDDSSTVENRVVMPSMNSMYSVSAIDINGCTVYDSVFVAVNPLPNHEYVSNDSLCAGMSDTVVLSGNASHYYWIGDNLHHNLFGDTLFVTANNTTTQYEVVYDNRYGCWDTTRFSVNVYQFPSPTITNDTTICRGDSILLTASGGTFFLWDDELHSTNNSIMVSPTDTTTYRVTVYDYFECNAVDSVEVRIIPYFDLSIFASADSVCPGTSVSFEAFGGEQYVWNGNVTSSTYSITADSTTIVSLNAANPETNCSRTVMDTIVVMPLPEVSIIANKDTICIGDTIILNINGDADYYFWNSDSTTSMSLVETPTVNTNYSVTAISHYQCKSVAERFIVVNPLPENFSINTEDLCYGDSTVVSIDHSYNNVRYLWNYPGITENTYTFYYHPLLNIEEEYTDTLSLVVVDANGCKRTNEKPILVYPLPRDTIFGPAEICQGDTLVLSTNGNHQYHWYQPVPQSQANSAEIRMLTSDTVLVRVSVSTAHCTVELDKKVVTHDLPIISIESTSGITLCQNEEYSLTATGAETYLWNDDQTGSTISITPPIQSSYSVVGTDINGCSNNKDILLNVITPPSLSLQIFPSDTICALDTFTVRSYGDFTNIIWSTQDTTYSITRSDIVTSTMISAEVSSSILQTHCITKDSVWIFVYPVPQLSVLANSAPICANDSGVIVVAGADTYEWMAHPHLASLTGAENMVRPNFSTTDYIDTFTVLGYLNDFNCKSVLQIPFMVNALPNLQITSSQGDDQLCLGDTMELQVIGGTQYSWYLLDNPNQPISNSSFIRVSPNQTTKYLVKGFNENGCFDTASFTLHVHPIPFLDIETQSEEICYGFSVPMTVTSNATNFSWTHSESLNDTSSNSPIATPLETTIYKVTASDTATGCQNSDIIEVVVHPSPVIVSNARPTICEGDSMDIQVSGASTYEWYDNILNTALYNGNIYTAFPQNIVDTQYFVVGTDYHGCRDTLPISIAVLELPQISNTISSPGFLCNDGSNFLGITMQSSTPNTFFQWSSYPFDATMAASQNVAFVSPSVSTTYVIDGYYTIDGVVCHNYDTANIAVFQPPIVKAASFPEIPCHDIEVTLSATGANHYMWFASGQILGTGNQISLIPSIGIPYIVAGTDTNNCIGRDTILLETIYMPPTDTITGVSQVCANQPTVLHTTGRNHCTWFPHPGLTNASDSAVTVTISETTTFKVSISNDYGCMDTLAYTLQVLPLPELVLPSDTTICEGDELTFRVTGATSYEWEDGSQNDFRTISPINTSTYTVEGTNQYNCHVIDSFKVTVFPAFDLHIVASNDTFCIEDNAITLIAYGAGDNYQWNTGSTDSIITVYPTTTTNYQLTAYNNTAGCMSSISHQVVKMDNPTANITISNPVLCLNDTADLSVILDAGESIVWNTGEICPTIKISPHDSTIYSAIVTNAFGCSSTASRLVQVTPLPEVNILKSDSVVCFGSPVTLTAIGNASSYQWSTGETTPTIIVNSPIETDFWVTGYLPTLCHSSDTVHIAIHPLPEGIISGPFETICPGDSVQLTISGGNDCSWKSNQNAVLGNQSSIWVTPNQTTQYTAILSTLQGCVDSTHFTISVFEPLPLQVSNDTVICLGEEVTLFAEGSWNYVWNNGCTSNSQTVSPTETTIYSVSSTDIHNCVTTMQVTVSVHPNFSIEIHHDKDTICIGDNVSFWCTGAADQFLWNTGSSSISITETPVHNMTYSVLASNNTTGCSKTASDSVVVIPYPVFSLSSANIICPNDLITIQAVSQYPFNYHWTSNPSETILSSQDSSAIIATPNVSSWFTCYANNHFCTLVDSVFVEVAQSPQIQVVQIENETCSQNNGLVSVNVSTEFPPVTYQWSNGSNSSIIDNLSSGSYSVFVTDALGCSNSMSDLVVENIPAPTIVVDNVLFSVNMGDGEIHIHIDSYFDDYEIRWYKNQEGEELTDYYNLTSVTNLYPGQYWILVTDAGCSTWMEVSVPILNYGEGALFVPNAITGSNTDNLNDMFRIYYAGSIDFEHIYIYNRWGGLVFESSNADFVWDGKYNGKYFANTVYNYVIFYRNAAGTAVTKKGSIITM